MQMMFFLFIGFSFWHLNSLYIPGYIYIWHNGMFFFDIAYKKMDIITNLSQKKQKKQQKKQQKT